MAVPAMLLAFGVSLRLDPLPGRGTHAREVGLIQVAKVVVHPLVAWGLGLAFGLLRPWAALGLAGFTVMASLTLLDFWRATGPERAAKRGQFLVNAGLLGGLLLAAAASF